MTPPSDEKRLAREAVSSRVTQAFAELRLGLGGDDVLIVAVSGGPDSICLLHALHRFTEDLKTARLHDPVHCSDWGFDLHVAHLHHGQRDEGGEDAVYVQEFSKSLNLPCTVERADVPGLAREERLSIEAAGRVARYRFFAKLAEELGSKVVATGHHADDQAETVLLRAFRGAGLRGLRGIPRVGPMPESGGRVTIIRPLLSVPRSVIEAYLEAEGITPRHDATNLDLRIQRNRIRHELMPLAEAISPGARTGLLRIARAAAEDEAALQAWTDTAWERCSRTAPDRVELIVEAMPEANAIRRRLLRRAVDRLLPEVGAGFPEANIEYFLSMCMAGVGSCTLDAMGGLEFSRAYDPGSGETRLILKRRIREESFQSSGFRRAVRVPGETALPELRLRFHAEEAEPESLGTFPPRDAWEAVMDADALKPPLFVRTWEPGDRMRVLGSGGTRKLQDLFTDARIPAEERRRWPVLCDAQRILWLPGLALNDAAKVTPETRRILRIAAHSPAEEE
ncbi:MAG: tRNA lysidine(34) synthetase TilS [Armatimonadetes bacterium]|nr:tRNA lysidine(34) synthetase TilS [Armatimonadota bacterium]